MSVRHLSMSVRHLSMSVRVAPSSSGVSWERVSWMLSRSPATLVFVASFSRPKRVPGSPSDSSASTLASSSPAGLREKYANKESRSVVPPTGVEGNSSPVVSSPSSTRIRPGRRGGGKSMPVYTGLLTPSDMACPATSFTKPFNLDSTPCAKAPPPASSASTSASAESAANLFVVVIARTEGEQGQKESVEARGGTKEATERKESRAGEPSVTPSEPRLPPSSLP
mmetsp:Transcript_9726/g.19466  ORF Transcript_9726/g.19466 Transcript_9726/m.19466 type:complete len:225 (-) Transcript_9726:40-714(-)